MSEAEVRYGDCRAVLPTLERKFQLLVTSPPYNTGQEYETKMSEQQYYEFMLSCYKAIYEVMDDNSRLCVNVPFNMTNPEGGISNVYMINCNAMNACGFKYRETIIWDQLNAENDTAWGSWKSASAPWLRHKTEAIAVYYKGDWKREKGVNDITRDEFLAYVVDIWRMNVARREGHPCPYPVELAMRCIKLFSFVGDWVLDPFLGSGSTLRACRESGRNGVGIELHEKYRPEIEHKALIGVGDITEFKNKYPIECPKCGKELNAMKDTRCECGKLVDDID